MILLVMPQSPFLGMILLKVEPTTSDEPTLFFKGNFENDETSIFVWSSVLVNMQVCEIRWGRGKNSKKNKIIGR
jgi:hypothetical protein